MPTLPLVTLNANLFSILGGGDISAAQLQITLAGYGQIPPAVAGSGLLADAGDPLLLSQSLSPISQLLFGNDVITPLGTYYSIAVLDGQGSIIQEGNYQFEQLGGANTVDLSTLIPIGSSYPSIFSEQPAGAYPGTAYTFSRLPVGGTLIGLYNRGVFQRPGIDYLLAGSALTMLYQTRPTDSLAGVYITSGSVGELIQPAQLIVDNLTAGIPGSAFTLSKTPMGGILLGLFATGVYQPPSLYTLAGTALTLDYTLQRGNLYAAYLTQVG